MIPSTTPFFSRVYADSPAKLPFLSEAYTLFNFGQTDYKLVQRNGVLELQNKWKMQPGFASTLVKIIIIATVIIPLLAVIAIAIYRSANQLKAEQKKDLKDDDQLVLELVAPYLNINDLCTSRGTSTSWRQVCHHDLIEKFNKREVLERKFLINLPEIAKILGDSCLKLMTLDLNDTFFNDNYLIRTLAFFPNIKHLFLNWAQITESSILSQLKDLETLHLERCSYLQSFSFLTELPKLQDLNLSDNQQIQNIDFISQCSSLTNLNLGTCKTLDNLDNLKNLTMLNQLNLESCFSIKNFDFLKSFSKITDISLSACFDLTDINFLEKYPSLTKIDLSCRSNFNQHEVFDIAPLKHCPNLKDINISYINKISNIDVLGSLTKIEKLNMHGTCIDDFDFLKNLHNLKFLHLSGPCNTEQLKNHPLLTFLQLYDNPNLNLNDIQNLPIETLVIQRCLNIIEFSPLLNFSYLKKITTFNVDIDDRVKQMLKQKNVDVQVF